MDHPVKKIPIQKTCVITPFIANGLASALHIQSIKRAGHIKYGLIDGLTLIETRIGAPYVADAVLNLKGSECGRILFTGSAGAAPSSKASLSIGSVVIVEKSYHNEALAPFIEQGINTDSAAVPDESLQKQIHHSFPHIPSVTAASVASLTLEETIQTASVDVMDMESASCLTAAKTVNIPAAAILYIADIIGETSPFTHSADKKTQHLITDMILTIVNQ